MVTRKKWLNKWAKRRARVKALRKQDKKYWTYRRLGRKFGVTTERARQLVNGKKNIVIL